MGAATSVFLRVISDGNSSTLGLQFRTTGQAGHWHVNAGEIHRSELDITLTLINVRFEV